MQLDIVNLQLAAASAGTDPALFMTAVSPGVVAQVFENRQYPSQDACVNAIADAMCVVWLHQHRSLDLRLAGPSPIELAAEGRS